MSDWKQLAEFKTLADYDRIYAETANGNPIKDTYGDYAGHVTDSTHNDDLAPGELEFKITKAVNERRRCEAASYQIGAGHAGCSPGAEMSYRWELLIPEIVVLPTWGKRYTNVNQFKTDANGYQGGVTLDCGTDALNHRIKGGEVIDASGSRTTAYEEDLTFGKIVRDEWTPIRVDVRWSEQGYSLCMVPGVSCATYSNPPIPTISTGGDGDEPTTRIGFRNGFYVPFVPPRGLLMKVRKCQVFWR